MIRTWNELYNGIKLMCLTQYFVRTMAEENQLDIVCTGCIMHYVASGEKYLRCVQEQLLFSRRLFSNALPVYHQFFRTSWGKLEVNPMVSLRKIIQYLAAPICATIIN